MNEIKVDKNVAALKLIEILLEKGMINQEKLHYQIGGNRKDFLGT